jgi:hypothetical protein
MTFQSTLVDPMARDRSLAMSRRRYRLQYMAEWLEDQVVAIGPFKLKSWILC